MSTRPDLSTGVSPGRRTFSLQKTRDVRVRIRHQFHARRTFRSRCIVQTSFRNFTTWEEFQRPDKRRWFPLIHDVIIVRHDRIPLWTKPWRDHIQDSSFGFTYTSLNVKVILATLILNSLYSLKLISFRLKKNRWKGYHPVLERLLYCTIFSSFIINFTLYFFEPLDVS